MCSSPEQQRLASSSTTTTTSNDPCTNLTLLITAVYVLSGCLQPIWMILLRNAGLADPSCQLFMLFYYLGTASAVLLPQGTPWPTPRNIVKASAIALWDVGAQTLNYTGALWTGPSIFAILYASVTIWAALYSQALLDRKLVANQWMAIVAVLGGLAMTATDSLELGPGVMHGVLLVTFGSSMRGLFYVLSEALMTTGQEQMTVQQNCAIQGMTASACFGVWQILYTLPHWKTNVQEPMEKAGTSFLLGVVLLAVFALLSFVHSLALYHTLRHVPGGSTSAGVVKGLQAVLVFVLTQIVYCGRIGGAEMCFSSIKFFSLVTVVGGVLWYGHATSQTVAEEEKAADAINYAAVTVRTENGAAEIETEPV